MSVFKDGYAFSIISGSFGPLAGGLQNVKLCVCYEGGKASFEAQVVYGKAFVAMDQLRGQSKLDALFELVYPEIKEAVISWALSAGIVSFNDIVPARRAARKASEAGGYHSVVFNGVSFVVYEEKEPFLENDETLCCVYLDGEEMEWD